MLASDVWLTLLESVTRADSLERAVAAAAMEFGLACPSQPVGLFVVLHDRVFLEFWYPENTPLRPLLRMQGLQITASCTAGEAGQVAGVPAESIAGQPRIAYAFALHDRLTGVLTLPRGEFSNDFVGRVVRLVVARLVALQAIEAELLKSAQFERWFRSSDRQLRALDGERQKFAALAGAVERPVFVTDPGGVVQWVSRPLLETLPEPVQGSWIGRPCHELCAASGDGSPACGDCVVTRALEGGKSLVRNAYEAPAAVTINDLDGQPREVMVVLRNPSRNLPRAA